MSSPSILEGIQLIPVVELEPFKFSTQSRNSPAGVYGEDDSEEWFRYWTDSLADSGITGLQPVRRASWYVPTMNFDVATNLCIFLEKTFQKWGGIDSLAEPDSKRVLYGGLALQCPASDLMIEPGCCSDLGTAKNWKDAAAHRGVEWRMLWIGHPWLSVRYQPPWLVLSEQHESDTPTDCWAVYPEELSQAADDASAELERFAGEIATALPRLGYRDDPALMSRKLVGLCE